VELPPEVLQTAATGKDSRLADYLRMLAGEIDKRQVPPEVEPGCYRMKPERMRVDYSEKINTMRASAAKSPGSAPAPKPRARAKITLLSPPISPESMPDPTSPWRNPNYNPRWEDFKNYAMAIGLVLGWIALPVLIIWLAWE
jgi:hypothetical protein